MKKILKHRGSAILLALMMILMILPLAIGLLGLNIMSGKNAVAAEDSQVADVATWAGINDVLQRNVDVPANFTVQGNYYVDIDTDTESESPNQIDLATIKRHHKYYEVSWVAGGPVTVTGYYAGIKHSYQITLSYVITKLY